MYVVFSAGTEANMGPAAPRSSRSGAVSRDEEGPPAPDTPLRPQRSRGVCPRGVSGYNDMV